LYIVSTEKFCIEKNVSILGRSFFVNELGKLNFEAIIAAKESEKYGIMFLSYFIQYI